MTLSFKTLLAYQKGFDLAMEIFHLTKSFPKSEMFLLTSQIVRSSRSVCSNIAEGYRKRKYEKYFRSKLSDSDSENSETQLWLEFAFACIFQKTKKKNFKTKVKTLENSLII